MYRLWRLALTLLALKIQSGVMADFVVTADTNSITVTWDDPTISGLSVFTISLDDELKFSGDDTAKPPVTINGLRSGTTHHLVIKTTTHGSTTSTIVVDEHKTTPMGDADVSGEHNGKVYKVYKEEKNYNDAKAACEATDDGHLVTVDGEGVQRVLKTLMERSIVTKAWLGAKRTKTDWRWVGSGKSLKYQGCFSDTGDARLSVSVSSKQDNTPDSCIAECRHRNNKYAGVKRDSNDGSKVVCRCGDYFKRDSHVNDCNDDCPTDGRQKCGKPNRMRIYAVDSVGVIGFIFDEPDNADNYDPCLVLRNFDGLTWGDVRCFHAQSNGYGYLCEYNTPQNICRGNYEAGKCYSIHSASSTGLSWYEARWECADNGGELLQVETKAFFDHLNVVLLEGHTWWIGSSRIRWQWPNGNELLYTNWASDSPNSETSACVVIDSGSKWKDMSCLRPNGFICETVGTLPTTTTTTTSHTKTTTTTTPHTKTTTTTTPHTKTTTAHRTKTLSSAATRPSQTTTPLNGFSGDSGKIIPTTATSMGTGTLIGIAVGTIVLLLLVILAVSLLIVWRMRQSNPPQNRPAFAEAVEEAPPSFRSPTVLATLEDGHWLHDLDQQHLYSRISEKALTFVAREIADIVEVGQIMGFSREKITQYQNTYPHSIPTQTTLMFSDWRQWDSPATVERFVKLMHEAHVSSDLVKHVITTQYSDDVNNGVLLH